MPAGELNESACAAQYDDVVWDDPTSLTILVIIFVIDVMVIVGNCLVIAAVYMSSKLRSVTNLFIVSLAVADLMVGVAVLPFSATWSVFKVWIFGDLWCSVWLAVDVWMCTASILNLCAISLDRYVAVTRPVTYPSIMSMGRAKVLVASVWVLSFVICFPPLVDFVLKHTGPTENTAGSPYTHCPWDCKLTDETGYVIYSALGSFFIPMFVMLFFYWRIYRAAVHTTKAINQGFRTTKGSKLGSRFDEQRLTLRIHRGRGSVMQGSSGSNSTNTTNSTSNSVNNSPGGGKSPETRTARSNRKTERARTHGKIKISVSYPSSEGISSAVNNNGSSAGGGGNISPKSGSFSSPSPPPSTPMYSVHYSSSDASSIYKSRDPSCHLRVTGARLATSHRRGRSNSNSPDSSYSARPGLLGESLSPAMAKDLSPSPTNEETQSKHKLISKMGKRNVKAQVKRFRMETKAAKTLAIIVGGFIICWCPFFTMYLTKAFCEDCINELAFGIMFWLGYCNSAINPCIYALFSKDFRFAFKRIICGCVCSKRVERKDSRYVRRGSDGSQLGVKRHERERSSSFNVNDVNHQQNSCGDDSDGNNEAGSESR
uniref:G-protein coupled receptors family 1 profile domain-containing protein n=1 Tax=Clastoptera arizonana TaxID=38151 RepID=A0A1B6EG77_9HEMI